MALSMKAGVFINKTLMMRTRQTHVHRYLKPLIEMIEKNEIDPAAIITHRLSLSEAPAAYKKFRDKEDGCIKVVFKP
jgi:threonine dehydrogenase-like Zn-dependent dehydrogenase